MESSQVFQGVIGVIMCDRPRRRLLVPNWRPQHFYKTWDPTWKSFVMVKFGELFVLRGRFGKLVGSHALPNVSVFLDAAGTVFAYFYSDGLGWGGYKPWSVEDVCSRYFDGLGSRQESKPMVLRGFEVAAKPPLFLVTSLSRGWSHLYEI